MNLPRRISVTEIHGIRRFFYPLSLKVPSSLLDAAPGLTLATPAGNPVPVQISPGKSAARLDFAVSLAPFEKMDLLLSTGSSDAALISDPLQTIERKGVLQRFRSSQLRFSMEFDSGGTIHEVVYDAQSYLRAPTSFTRNGRPAVYGKTWASAAGFPLCARVSGAGLYPDGCGAKTRLETTACKSWATLAHLLSRPLPGDRLIFHLPLRVSSPVVTCDFGAGGGIYGAIQSPASPEIVWQSEFLPSRGVRWSIRQGERTDYAGQVESSEEYLRKRWFHWIDGRKALAVAVTQLPASCTQMEVRLCAGGDIFVAFQTGESAHAPAAFGLCCHFLNDIPAIAAATNPQSILLPPVVSKDF